MPFLENIVEYCWQHKYFLKNKFFIYCLLVFISYFRLTQTSTWKLFLFIGKATFSVCLFVCFDSFHIYHQKCLINPASIPGQFICREREGPGIEVVINLVSKYRLCHLTRRCIPMEILRRFLVISGCQI